MPHLALTFTWFNPTILGLRKSRPFQDPKLKDPTFPALVQGWVPAFQYDPQEMSINSYSEIDITYGSTLIILINSNHFRMTQTWMLFPGHYGHV